MGEIQDSQNIITVDYHADDYALSVNTSKDMLECMKAGFLDSISVVPNMSCYDECMKMFKDAIPTLPFLPLISVHIDIVEGRSLAWEELNKNVVFADDEGIMTYSWGKFFVCSILCGKKHPIRKNLYDEVRLQIEKVQKDVEECISIAKENGVKTTQKGLRIDSHQHAHMIPIVFNTITSVIKDKSYQTEYIRNSKEPIKSFIKATDLYSTYRPVNFVKNRILDLYSYKVDRYYKKMGLSKMYLWGLIMSGHMDSDRISRLMPDVLKESEDAGRTLEVLFHPGILLKDEITGEIPQTSVNDFYLKEDRHVEKKALEMLRSKK